MKKTIHLFLVIHFSTKANVISFLCLSTTSEALSKSERFLSSKGIANCFLNTFNTGIFFTDYFQQITEPKKSSALFKNHLPAATRVMSLSASFVSSALAT